MITTMLTPHHRTLLVHCEPLSVVTHVKHMSAELTHHEQTPQRLVTNRTERESLCLHALRRVRRALCCTLHHAVPAAIEEAADEEDDAIAGLGGCVREERIEEFDARQVIQFAILFRSV